MNKALIYRARSRGLVWVAFACAVALHVTAIVLAENKSKAVSTGLGPFVPDVIGIDDNPAPSPQEQEVAPEAPPVVTDEDAFPDEEPTRPPIRPRKKMPTTPVVRSIGAGTTRAMQPGSVKALTVFAPRPNYPYEARRSGITGSGVAQVTVNSAAGNVIDARMAQTTGNAILDKETVETLRRWRFKPGVASNVDVPITYMLTGVSY